MPTLASKDIVGLRTPCVDIMKFLPGCMNNVGVGSWSLPLPAQVVPYACRRFSFVFMNRPVTCQLFDTW